MPYELPRGTKFAAIHLIGCGRTDDFSDTALGDGFSAHSATFLKLTDLDKRRLGDDRVRDVENASVVLLAARSSAMPTVRDAEWQEMSVRGQILLYALLLHGVPTLKHVIAAHGGVDDRGGLFVGSIGFDRIYYRSPHITPLRVSAAVMRSARGIADGLVRLYLPRSPEFVSVRRGFRGIIDGWRSDDVLDRLHQFVRALDGIMRLPRGAGAVQFGKRAALLAHADGFDVETMAREAYFLRNYDEHLTEWPAGLDRLATAEARREFVARAEFHVEALATLAYRRILSDCEIRDQFRDKDVIASFWAGGARTWGDRLDLDEQAKLFTYGAHDD
jgi:hypothetical protein